MVGSGPNGPLADPVREPPRIDEEPTLGSKVAYVGTEVGSDVAKYAVGEAVGSAFSAAYMVVLVIGAVGIMIGALVVVVIGWGVSVLALAEVAPGAGAPIAAFWGLVGLVILFFGIRWLVRRVGRPMERGLDRTLATVSAAVDRRRPDANSAGPESPTEPAPTVTRRVQPTLAELDARLARSPIDPEAPQ